MPILSTTLPRWPRARLLIMAVGLAVLGLAAPPGSDAQVVTPPPAAEPDDPETSAFQHARHRSITCGVCHAEEDRHRSSRSWTAQDCAACHHRDSATAACSSCHESTELAGPRRATTAMALSVWEEARVRELPFDHERHAEVDCASCHQGGVSLPPRSCASCHESHHQDVADCAGCHQPPEPAAHDLAIHASCAGSGCHSMEASPRPMLSRSSCELCHEEQRDHRPGRSCVQCHAMPETTSRE